MTISTQKLSEDERKERASASRKRWRDRNPTKHRERHLKNRYGISLEQRDAMFTAQGSVCAICKGDDPLKGGQDWVVDHCHNTGRIRGILCHPCNLMLGGARDNPQILSNAIHYLN